MKELMLRALDLAEVRGAQYADVRIVETTNQQIAAKDGVVTTLTVDESRGFGIRVLFEGAWGFASSQTLSGSEVDRMTDLACQIARASALVPGKSLISLGPPISSQGMYQTPLQIDPLAVPIEDKVAMLLEADREMGRVEGVKVRRGNVVAIREHKLFANSQGAFTDQLIYEVGAGISALAVSEGDVQVRSYPNSHSRQQVTGGWEMVQQWDLPGNAGRVATEAVQLLNAEACPRDVTTTVILGGTQLALQIHESCGHPIELDRVFGAEAAFAGTSFLTTEKLNRFRYGSEVVNITADAVRPQGLGTFGWDDEGVPAQSTPIVRDGIFTGYLMSRETASELGLVSNGCMRASSWNRLPLIRMTNVSIEPGDWRLDDLIADTEEGIFMDVNRSWSIDDRRYNFQFGTEMGYEIKNGKLGRMLRNCTYTGITPEFWRSCDAVCDEDHWQMWGTPNCGKGQPLQVAHTGHGAAPARFRNVRVGIG
ncbi:MAG: TldD/PmbA family protein [Candidatus Promineifilaceae bacterium]|nr:TldD/PmbA family protein [Candidatus Promineifilaceae bacterium]